MYIGNGITVVKSVREGKGRSNYKTIDSTQRVLIFIYNIYRFLSKGFSLIHIVFID